MNVELSAKPLSHIISMCRFTSHRPALALGRKFAAAVVTGVSCIEELRTPAAQENSH